MNRNFNPNNDSLQCLIGRNISVLCGYAIASSGDFSDVNKTYRPALTGMVYCFKNLFEKFDEYENNLFYFHLNSENDAFVNQLLTSLSNFMHTAIKLLEDDKSYSAHVAAVYVLSIFSICPTLLRRAEVYDYLRNLRKEFVI